MLARRAARERRKYTAHQTTNNNSIRSIVEKEKLNGSNFLDWYRNLRNVLRNEQKFHHLEEALPEAPPATTTAAVRNAYTRRVTEQQEVACLILVSMTLKIQKNLEDRPAFEILQELKTIFQQQAEQELFETVKAFHACKQEEGQSISTYVLKMKAYLDQMEHLGYPMPLVLGVNMILTSLSKDYDQFVQNYNMHDTGKTIPELHAMLKLAEKGIPKKTPIVLAIRQGQIQKPKSQARGKGKSKLAYDPKHKIPPHAKKQHPAKDSECHYYHKTGHWKRNSPLYLAELKKNKASTSGTSAIEAIGSFNLILPSGIILVLDNCVIFPTITRGVISLSRLWDNGFRHKFMDNGTISVSNDNIVYFNAFPRDGIFEIDMHNHMSNERSIYTCSNKKTHNLDSTFLWHYRLGHINKKSIMKLQHDGLLELIDDESFDVCVSCISGKMARKHFTHTSERVDDLLGSIHSDGYALESAARILNMVPTKKALVKRDMPNKLESRSIKCIFVGLPKEIIGYYFYYPLENKIFVARYAEFFETNLIKQEASGSIVDFDEIQSEDAQPSEITSLHQHEVEHDTVEPQTDVIPFRRSARIPQAPERYGFYIDAEEHELGDHGEPPNYQAALSDPESENKRFHYYEETFSPVADIKAIRILIAIAAYYGYEIWQIDVKTAFLNGRLNKDVYIVQPEGFANHKHPTRVCKLQRSIYGLKQAYRSWNKRFDEEINKKQHSNATRCKILAWKMFCYERLRMDTSKHGTILMQPNVDLGKSQGPSTPAEVKRMKGIPYASVVGSIMYAVRCTRPDVAFSQKLTSRYQQNLRESHWTAVKNILKYLRNTKDMFLVYGGVSTTELGVTCYTDASWWSSMEAEYIAAMEAIWIHKFIFGLGVVPIIDKPIDMYCDNISAITIADEPGVQKGAKHF
ncbi:retrotransposon protein, putative, ty1-copia subclass [Tanacetum coccineum]